VRDSIRVRNYDLCFVHEMSEWLWRYRRQVSTVITFSISCCLRFGYALIFGESPCTLAVACIHSLIDHGPVVCFWMSSGFLWGRAFWIFMTVMNKKKRILYDSVLAPQGEKLILLVGAC
jgi:hypothetical protein